ncbi:MAG: ATP-binding protein [Gammaproteobacteria bacterium]|nr:ATP-binding protein [Gammaproteobacteria bacterium]
MARRKRKPGKRSNTGKLRIGDDWNAITIIALSQSNPLKAVAEFVENSIDAGAKNITITRGKERGENYLMVSDDGQGIPKDEAGIPDFHYVATHICDSIKRRLKQDGVEGIQGEFGIGLLSFWTLGETLSLTCASADGQTHRMGMKKGDPGYYVSKRRVMFPPAGTELKVKPLLTGIRQLSGEKIQWYLASELRDRIRTRQVNIKVIDRTARKTFDVEPREFDGRLLHQLPRVRTGAGDIYLELFFSESRLHRKVGLYRHGTRVLEDISKLDGLNSEVWGSGYLEGIVDVPFLNLTPGTRSGIVYDDQFAMASEALKPLEARLAAIIEEQRAAEEEHASRQVLRSIQKAFREALLALPVEEYDWFDIQSGAAGSSRRKVSAETGNDVAIANPVVADDVASGIPIDGAFAIQQQDPAEGALQREFFDYPGPLHNVRISPASSILRIGSTRTLQAIARDRSGRRVEQDLTFFWEILEGGADLENPLKEIVILKSGNEPCLARVKVTVRQKDTSREAEALVTITDTLLEENQPAAGNRAGLPGYTYQHAAGELWRSYYDENQNLIVINNGHRDFVYASKTKALKLRYIARLFAKELVYKNFPGLPADKLLERMIELSLYTEEHLK